MVVIRYEGPRGGPGMREMLAPTSSIIGRGLGKEVALITDGRFSGGSHGFVIGHITPEAFCGGPIAVVKDGDLIEIDALMLGLRRSRAIYGVCSLNMPGRSPQPRLALLLIKIC